MSEYEQGFEELTEKQMKQYEILELDLPPAAQLVAEAFMNEGALRERERIIQLLHSDAGRNILVKGGNAFGNAIMLEVLIKGENSE